MNKSKLLPSMPLLFSNSQQEEIKVESKVQNDENEVDSKAQEFKIESPQGNKEIPTEKTVLPEIAFETIPEGEKECEDELVLLAESSPCSEKRKLVQNQPKKKKRLDSGNETQNDKDGTHYAEAYFMRAKSVLDEATFQQFTAVLSEAVEEPGAAVSLYKKMTEILSNYPQLLDDFIGFLKPHQAQECGKLIDLQYFEKCWSFFKKMDAHQSNKFHHTLEQQSNATSSESLKSNLLPIFKGNTQLSESFLHLLPGEKPPPSSREDYEDISETSVEESGWERIRIPEHPDRGCQPECTCRCHISEDKLFCLSCNLKFLNGQIYIRDGKVLRFARISFGDTPLEDMLEKLHPSLYSKRRRKRRTSKSVNSQNKEVPSEDHEDAEKLKEDLQPASSPDRCDKTEEEDDYWEEDDVSSGDKSSICDPFDGSLEDPDTCDSTKFLSQIQPISPIYSLIDEESQKGTIDSAKDEIQDNPDEIKDDKEKVWTREEDKMILQTFQKEIGTEQTFSKISNLMPSRSVNDIQGRFQVLMNLLEKVASGSHETYPA